jgi:hypothetical protein
MVIVVIMILMMMIISVVKGNQNVTTVEKEDVDEVAVQFKHP